MRQCDFRVEGTSERCTLDAQWYLDCTPTTYACNFHKERRWSLVSPALIKRIIVGRQLV